MKGQRNSPAKNAHTDLLVYSWSIAWYFWKFIKSETSDQENHNPTEPIIHHNTSYGRLLLNNYCIY